MTWNYRLFKQDTSTDVEETFYFVGECYYEDDGSVISHSTMDHNLISGDTETDVQDVYKMVAEAFNRPVVELDGDGNFKGVL